MKKITRYAILLLSIAVLFMQGCGSNSTSPMNNDGPNNMDDPNNPDDPPESREEAPDFTYVSLGGMEHTLSDYEGKVVYIFFFGSNCPHCRDNGPVTEDEIHKPFQDNSDFVALGLDTWNTSASEVDAFKNVTGITYPLLLNAQQSLIDYYGNTSSYDRSVVVDADGKIAYKGTNYVDTDVDEVQNVIQEELAKLE